MVGKHDRSLLIQSDRHRLGGQGAGRVDTERGVSDDVAGEAAEPFIEETEGNRIVRVGCDGPVVLVVPNISAMERVAFVVLRNLVANAVDFESAISNSICVPTNDCTVVCVVGERIGKILFGVIVSKNNVLFLSIPVGHEERGQAGSIRDKARRDVLCTDSVQFKRIDAFLWRFVRVVREIGRRLREHWEDGEGVRRQGGFREMHRED